MPTLWELSFQGFYLVFFSCSGIICDYIAVYILAVGCLAYVLECINLNLWFTETENSNLALQYHINKVLAHKDEYQELLVVETDRFGRT